MWRVEREAHPTCSYSTARTMGVDRCPYCNTERPPRRPAHLPTYMTTLPRRRSRIRYERRAAPDTKINHIYVSLYDQETRRRTRKIANVITAHAKRHVSALFMSRNSRTSFLLYSVDLSTNRAVQVNSGKCRSIS